MLPLLKFASDGNEHSTKEAIESLSYYFKLTNEEKNLYPYPQIYLMFVVLSAMPGEDSKSAVLFVS